MVSVVLEYGLRLSIRRGKAVKAQIRIEAIKGAQRLPTDGNIIDTNGLYQSLSYLFTINILRKGLERSQQV